MDVGQTLQLTAGITPANAFDKTVNWVSSNPAVATVSSSGVVTFISGGVASITATAVYGGVQATCRVTSLVPVTGIRISHSTLGILSSDGTGKLPVSMVHSRLTPVITPDNATVKDVVWTSSSPGVATVSQDGILTCLSHGTTIITVTSARYGNVSASCTFIFQDTVATLASLTTSLGDFDGSFSPFKFSYEKKVPYHSGNPVKIFATTSSPYATLLSPQEYEIIPGNNYATVSVKSEYGNILSYDMKIYRLHGDATLKSITVSSVSPGNENDYEPLSPVTGDIFTYRVNVPGAVDQVKISCKTNEYHAFVTEEIGKSLEYGDNEVIITVFAEDESVYINYHLIIRRLSNITDISLLTLNGEAVQPSASSPSLYVYDRNLLFSEEFIHLNVIPADEKTVVSIEENQHLSVGENTIIFKLTAEDGTEKFYTLKARRLSNDTNLEFLSVNGKVFSGYDRPVYYDTVPYLTDYADIHAVASDLNASVKDFGKYLTVGDNVLKFEVTAEDTTIRKVYTFYIILL